MALNKSKLTARIKDKNPATPLLKVPLTDLTKPTKANDRTVDRSNATPLKAVPKRTRAKDGVKNTQRYSFEITAELKDQLERAVIEHRLNTGKKISTSAVIRKAITKYLKGGKL